MPSNGRHLKKRDQRSLPESHLRKDADPDIPILKQAKAEYARAVKISGTSQRQV
jgi:hypothetical protein